MPWFLLAAAIAFEIAGITSMKLSRGLSAPLASVGVVVFYLVSLACVTFALKRIELSVAYAVWSGVGTAITAFIGIAYFREPLTSLKLVSLALVIGGVIGLGLASRQTN